MTTRVVLIGSGGHAKVVLEILRAMGGFDVVGVVTADQSVFQFGGMPVLGGDEVLPGLREAGVAHLAVGVGGFRDNELRKRVYARGKRLGFTAVTAIHPSVVRPPSATVGEGSVLFPGVVLNTEVSVGCNSVIATGATIDHETVIESHVLVSAGVTVGGNVIVREGALLAIGSTIVSGVEVGRNALVAAGAVVVRAVPEGATVYGVPAAPRVREPIP